MENKFGSVLKRIRTELGMAQSEFSALCRKKSNIKLKISHLSQIENNRLIPSLLYTQKIINIFPNYKEELMAAYDESKKCGMTGSPYKLSSRDGASIKDAINTLIGRMEHIQSQIDQLKETYPHADLIDRIKKIEEEIKERINIKDFRYTVDKVLDTIASNQVHCDVRRDEYMDFKKSIWAYILFCISSLWISIKAIQYIFHLLI